MASQPGQSRNAAEDEGQDGGARGWIEAYHNVDLKAAPQGRPGSGAARR